VSTALFAPRRVTPQAAALVGIAALAWVVTALQAQDMGVMPGTMGLGLAAFVLIWTPMMAAMMLPAVAPLASMYARSVRARRTLRLGAFAGGYLLVWVAAGVPAFGLAWLAGRLADDHPTAAIAAAAAIFAACGAYQLSPLKHRCLKHCRSPLSLLLRYGSYRGALRDVRAGLHHGAYCLGCCWALFALLVAVGVMNLGAMLALAAVVVIEKLWSRGEAFSRAVGVAALALAVAVIWIPELAPGLHGTAGAMAGPTMTMTP
jgi:predicted metal-binding membrane protein